MIKLNTLYLVLNKY